MKNQIKDKSFFYGGKAIFTVSNNKGNHYTFKVSTIKDDPESPYFVSVLTGPDNCTNYTYVGILHRLGFVRMTKKSKYNSESTVVKVFDWAVKQVFENKTLPDGYSIHHEGKCCRCGRRLTTPESVEKGIGPECEKRRK
jgi:hypothetical protein